MHVRQHHPVAGDEASSEQWRELFAGNVVPAIPGNGGFGGHSNSVRGRQIGPTETKRAKPFRQGDSRGLDVVRVVKNIRTLKALYAADVRAPSSPTLVHSNR